MIKIAELKDQIKQLNNMKFKNNQRNEVNLQTNSTSLSDNVGKFPDINGKNSVVRSQSIEDDRKFDRIIQLYERCLLVCACYPGIYLYNFIVYYYIRV